MQEGSSHSTEALKRNTVQEKKTKRLETFDEKSKCHDESSRQRKVKPPQNKENKRKKRVTGPDKAHIVENEEEQELIVLGACHFENTSVRILSTVEPYDSFD